MNTRNLTLTVIAITLAYSANAQNNQIAIGWRFGMTEGITARGNLGNGLMIEGIAGFSRGYSFTALLEKMNETKYTGLSYYYGGGVHVGRTGDRYYWPYHRKHGYYAGYYRTAHWGPDLILGVEYLFPKTPIALSLDIKPTAHFYEGGAVRTYADPGLGLKIRF